MKNFYLLLIILATNFACSKNKVADLIIIPFQLSEDGHILVEANLNGVMGVFIFDSGAGLNIITKNFANKLGNLKKTDGFYTGQRATGEVLQADLWKTDSLSMGFFKSYNQTFAVFDAELPIAGIISLLPFRHIPFTIDYGNQVLRIETEKSLQKIKKNGKVIPIQIEDNREKALDIFTYISLNNKMKLQVALDCGAGFNVYRFNSRYMKSLGIDTLQVTSEYKKWDFDPTQGNNYYHTRLSNLKSYNGTVEINDFKAQFIEDLIYEGIVSMNWLGREITINIENKELIVK